MKKNLLDLNTRKQNILNKINKKKQHQRLVQITKKYIKKQQIKINKKFSQTLQKFNKLKKIKNMKKKINQLKSKQAKNNQSIKKSQKIVKTMKVKNNKNKIIFKNKPNKQIKNKGKNILKQIQNGYLSNVLLIEDKKQLEINANTLKSTNKKNKKSMNQIKQIDLTLQDHNIKIDNNQSQIKKSKSKLKEIKQKIKIDKVTAVKQKSIKNQQKKSIQKPTILNQVNQNPTVHVPKKIGRPKKIPSLQNQQVKEINLNHRKILQQVLQKTIKLCKIKNQKQFYQLFGRIKMYLKESYFYGDLVNKLPYQPTSQQLEQLGVIISKNIRIHQQITSMNNNFNSTNGINNQIHLNNGTI